MIESLYLSIALLLLVLVVSVVSFSFLKSNAKTRASNKFESQPAEQAAPGPVFANTMALGGDAKDAAASSTPNGKSNSTSRITPIFTIDEVESTDVLPAETNASALLGNNPNLSMDSKRFRRHAKQLR